MNPVVPPRYLTEDDHIADRVNPEYEAWEVQDQTLLVFQTFKSMVELQLNTKIKSFQGGR